MFSISNSESLPLLRWLCQTLSAECIRFTISSCWCRDCRSSLSDCHHKSQSVRLCWQTLSCYSQYVMCCPYHILICLYGQRSNICMIQPLDIHETYSWLPWCARLLLPFARDYDYCVLIEILIACLYSVSVANVRCPQCLYTVSTIPNAKDAACD